MKFMFTGQLLFFYSFKKTSKVRKRKSKTTNSFASIHKIYDTAFVVPVQFPEIHFCLFFHKGLLFFHKGKEETKNDTGNKGWIVRIKCGRG